MLQAIRDKAQGWIAWVIVILITIPFALWGIQEYLGVGGEPNAARVNDRDITERELDASFQRFRMQLRDQLGAAYKAGVLDDAMLKRQVLGSLIRNELLVQAAVRQKMQVGDDMVRSAIAAIPSFQKAGRFDYPSYERGLRQQGMTPDLFTQRMRGGLIVDQLTQAIQESEFTTPYELEQTVRLREQKRDLSYLSFPASAYQFEGEVDGAELNTYYQAHKEAYIAPERVKLEYVELSIETLSKQIEVDDEKLQAFMESHSDDFHLPEERRASHILVAVKDDKEGEAQQKAEALLARIKKGESFEEIAKANSDDPGSAKQGGDLGFFAKGVMDEAFEKAAYNLKQDEVSELVRSPFGYHIIKMTGVRGGGKAELAAVRDRVLAAYTRDEAQKQFYALAERMADLAYETPDSLEPIVETLKLPMQSSDWLTRQGGAGVLSSPKVLGAAFSEDVLSRGNNSEALELAQEHLLILRVVSHETAAPKPFEQVKDEVLAAVKAEKSSTMAAEAADKALKQLESGETLDDVAKQSAMELKTPGLVSRTVQDIPLPILLKAFKLPRPDEGQRVYADVAMNNGDHAVVAVGKVEDGVLDKEKAATGISLARMRGNRYYDLYLSALEEGADIEYLIKDKKGFE